MPSLLVTRAPADVPPTQQQSVSHFYWRYSRLCRCHVSLTESAQVQERRGGARAQSPPLALWQETAADPSQLVPATRVPAWVTTVHLFLLPHLLDRQRAASRRSFSRRQGLSPRERLRRFGLRGGRALLALGLPWLATDDELSPPPPSSSPTSLLDAACPQDTQHKPRPADFPSSFEQAPDVRTSKAARSLLPSLSRAAERAGAPSLRPPSRPSHLASGLSPRMLPPLLLSLALWLGLATAAPYDARWADYNMNTNPGPSLSPLGCPFITRAAARCRLRPAARRTLPFAIGSRAGP